MEDTVHVAVGYFLTRPVVCEWLDGSRFSSRVLTLNEHLAATLPSPFFLEGSDDPPGQREQARLRVLDFLSIDPGRLEELLAWYVDPANSGQVDWDPPYGSVGLRFVREAARRFLPAGTDANILGLSAHASDTDAMARCFGVENDEPFVPEWVGRRAPPERGGKVLGFEPAPILRECPQRGCSWICAGINWDEVERELDLHPNEHGLLGTYDEACRASAWLRERGAGAGCCGDRWFPWRLASYPLVP